jgi:hypothetical protein
MSLPIPYDYRILHAPGIYARVLVNDIPFYRRIVDCNMAPAGPFNHLIVPGENVVRIELAEAGENDPTIIRTFEMTVLRQVDGAVRFREKWPDFAKEYPEEERKLPIVHERKLQSDCETPLPVWWDSPHERFPSEGTRDLHDAVRALHDAYARADVDEFLYLVELKFAEHKKYYGAVPDLAPEAAKERYGALLREPWDLDPYDPKEIVFEHRAGGRVAYATRRDGSHALRARHKTDPSQSWTANLLLTRRDGRWRIFW